MTTLTLIAALSKNGVIGKNNDIPWRLPEDLKHFKRTTAGHVVIMGRKTFESLGNKPLPNRVNIVISRHHVEGSPPDPIAISENTWLFKATSIRDALAMAQGSASSQDREIFVIGGAQIYEETIGIADRLILSHVELDVDTTNAVFFPQVDESLFNVVSTQYHPAEPDIAFSVCTYLKRRF